jgi:hypothetical protein
LIAECLYGQGTASLDAVGRFARLLQSEDSHSRLVSMMLLCELCAKERLSVLEARLLLGIAASPSTSGERNAREIVLQAVNAR